MWRSYDQLSQCEQDLYAQLVGEIAKFMHCFMSDVTRKSLKLPKRTIYNPGPSGIREAFALLHQFKLLKPVYANASLLRRNKGGTPFGQLKCDLEKITLRLAKQPQNNSAYFEEVVDAYVHLGEFIGLPTSRSWFTCEQKYLPMMDQLLKVGFVNRNHGQYRWSDKVSFSMWRTGVWNHKDETERETRLLAPLIEKLVSDIPDYVTTTIEKNIADQKHGRAAINFDDPKRCIEYAIERALGTHYRCETWMPVEEARRFPGTEYYDGIKPKLVSELNQKFS